MWNLNDRPECEGTPRYERMQTRSSTLHTVLEQQIDTDEPSSHSMQTRRSTKVYKARVSSSSYEKQELNRSAYGEMSPQRRGERRMYRNDMPYEKRWGTEGCCSQYQAMYPHTQQGNNADRTSHCQTSHLPGRSNSPNFSHAHSQVVAGKQRQASRRAGREYTYVEQQNVPQDQDMGPTQRRMKWPHKQTKLPPIQKGTRNTAIAPPRQLISVEEQQHRALPSLVCRHGREEDHGERNPRRKRRIGVSQETDDTRKDRILFRVLSKRF